MLAATPTSRWTWLAAQLSVALTGTLIAYGIGEGIAHGMTVSEARARCRA